MASLFILLNRIVRFGIAGVVFLLLLAPLHASASFCLFEDLRVMLSPTKNVPAEYTSRNTDNFKVVDVRPGQHGGKLLTIQRLGSWSDGRKDFLPGGGDLVQDLRIYPRVLGDKIANFFGFRVISNRYTIIPEENEINGAIDQFNQGLAPNAPERIKISVYSSRESFGSPREFATRFAREGKVPVSTVGRQFYHDTLGHALEGLYLHNDFERVLQARSNLWLDFVESEKPKLSIEVVSVLNQIDETVLTMFTAVEDQIANLTGSFFHTADRKYLEQVGDKVAMKAFVKAHNRRRPTDHITTRTVIITGGPRLHIPKEGFTLLDGNAEEYFSEALSEHPQLLADFIQYFQHAQAVHKYDLSPVSFDWKADLLWLYDNSDKIAKSSQDLVPHLEKLELTRPYFLRIKRLNDLTQ